jgi:hypothetical protein
MNVAMQDLTPFVGFTVFVVVAGQRVFTTERGTAYATADAVIVRGSVQGYEFPSCAGHDFIRKVFLFAASEFNDYRLSVK